MTALNVPITQAQTTRAEIDAAAASGKVAQSRLYHLTDEDVLALGTSPSTYVVVGTGGGDLETKGENIPGSGQTIEAAVNGHMFVGPDSDGEGRICVGPATILYVGYENVVYRYFGPSSVCLGAGGAGGQYPHHTSGADDWVTSGTTDHNALSNRDSADAHPQGAVTGLVADQAAQDSRLDALEAHGHDHNALSNRDAADAHPQGAVTGLVADQGAQNARLDAIESSLPSKLESVDLSASHGASSVTITNTAGDNAVINAAGANAGVMSAAQKATLDSALQALQDDTAPKLGGVLFTQGFDIDIVTASDEYRGALGETQDPDDLKDMVYLTYLNPDGTYDPVAGALTLKAGQIELRGGNVRVDVLIDAAKPQRQVYVTDDGLLYGVDPPAPGWEVSATDANDYDLGTGTGAGAWVQMTDLSVAVPEDVAAGERIDVFANVDATNKTGNRSGTIDIGFGVDGAEPASWSNHSIPPGFDGYIPVSLTTTTHGGLVTGNTISVWARRASGSHAQFGVDLIGGVGDEHELIVSTPGESGGGGGGDPTNISILHGPSSVTVQSSTGTDGVINAAGANAGVMTAAQKATLDSALQSVNLAATHSPTGVTITNTGGNNANLQLATTVNAGVMDPDDKDKLDNVQEGAQVNPSDAAIVASVDTELGHTDWKKQTGTGAGTHAAGNDARLSDARTPTAHGSTHGPGGADEVPGLPARHTMQLAMTAPGDGPTLNEYFYLNADLDGMILREIHLGCGSAGASGSTLVVTIERATTWASGSYSTIATVSISSGQSETYQTGYNQAVSINDKIRARVSSLDSGANAKDLILTTFWEIP